MKPRETNVQRLATCKSSNKIWSSLETTFINWMVGLSFLYFMNLCCSPDFVESKNECRCDTCWILKCQFLDYVKFRKVALNICKEKLDFEEPQIKRSRLFWFCESFSTRYCDWRSILYTYLRTVWNAAEFLFAPHNHWIFKLDSFITWRDWRILTKLIRVSWDKDAF